MLAPLIDCEDVELAWQGVATLNAPSGAGKTTLFRLLSGWYPLTTNSYCHFGPPLDPFKTIRLVGSHRSLLPWKTVRQNALFHLLQSDSIEAALIAVGLNADVASLYPYQLSLGMYKRIELALAVLHRPKLLLLDEFYSSVADKQKELIKEFLTKTRGHEMTWIIAHEERLRKWVGGPEYTFMMRGVSVVGIERT